VVCRSRIDSWVGHSDNFSQQTYTYSRQDILALVGGLPTLWASCASRTTVGKRSKFHFLYADADSSTDGAQHAEVRSIRGLAPDSTIFEDGIIPQASTSTFTVPLGYELKIKSIEQNSVQDGQLNTCYFLARYYKLRDTVTEQAVDYCSLDAKDGRAPMTCANYSLSYFTLSRHYYALSLLMEEFVNTNRFEYAHALGQVIYHKLLPTIDVVAPSAANTESSSNVIPYEFPVIGEYYADKLVDQKFKNLLVLTELSAEIEYQYLGSPYACALLLILGSSGRYIRTDKVYEWNL
jgi:hypothetical protein